MSPAGEDGFLVRRGADGISTAHDVQVCPVAPIEMLISSESDRHCSIDEDAERQNAHAHIACTHSGTFACLLSLSPEFEARSATALHVCSKKQHQDQELVYGSEKEEE